MSTAIPVVPVPLDRFGDSGAEGHLGLPAGEFGQFGRVDELAVDFTRGHAVTQEFGLDQFGTFAGGFVGDQLDDRPYRPGFAGSGVEGFAATGTVFHRTFNRQVGGGRVADMQVVPFGRAVGADLRRAPGQAAASRSPAP